MTPDEIKQFSSARTSVLVEPIAALVEQVIAKGMQGIIEECVAMKLRIQELEAQVADYAGMYQPFKAMVDDVNDAGKSK